MKKTNKSQMIKLLVAPIAFFLLLSACSENILNEIDTNPNAPTDVPISQLLPRATMVAIYSVTGGYTANGISTYAEHTTNVRLNTIDPDDVENNLWSEAYSALNDLQIMLDKAEAFGSYSYVGIGKVLFVYILSVTTDTYGDIPLTEALQGSDIRQPTFDTQESIYNTMFTLLDEAIVDLDRSTVDNPGDADLIFGGDVAQWKKTAYGLKARLWNRLSELNPRQSAEEVLSAIALSFEPGEGFVFNRYLSGSVNDNPWTGQQKSQQMFAVSKTVLDVMNSFTEIPDTDPRMELWFTQIDSAFVGAPAGTDISDPAHIIYSAPSPATVLFDQAAQPILMYDELKFIEAEANLRLGNQTEANQAYEAAVESALARAGIAPEEINAYIGQGSVFPGAEALTLADIMQQKWLSFWMFQSLEAYNDVRRTGLPVMQNSNSFPLRIPYPEAARSRNPNTPDNINIVTIYTIPVWWDQ